MTKHASATLESFQSSFYNLLLRIRPAELADIAKKMLGIKRHVVTTKDGLQLWIDPVSHFGLETLTTKTYEPLMTSIVKNLLRTGDCFVDIGGNEGYFSVLAALKVGNGKVHCIEPQARLQAVIQKNISLNNTRNLQVYEVALSDSNGTVDLFLRPSTNTGSTSLFNHTKFGGKRQEVRSQTFDSFVKEHSISQVRLLKVDCEGAEDLVILNGKSLFEKNKVDFIALEYHHSIRDRKNLDSVHAFLVECGYAPLSIENQMIYHLPHLKSDLAFLGK